MTGGISRIKDEVGGKEVGDYGRKWENLSGTSIAGGYGKQHYMKDNKLFWFTVAMAICWIFCIILATRIEFEATEEDNLLQMQQANQILFFNIP